MNEKKKELLFHPLKWNKRGLIMERKWDWDLDKGNPYLPSSVQMGEIPLTLDQAKFAIEYGRHELKVYADAINEMKKEAQELVVQDEESLSFSVSLGIKAKKLAKEIDNTKNKIIAPANEFIKAVRNFAGEYTQVLDEIEKITKQKNRAFKALQEQREREAQKKLEEEIEKIRAKVKEEADKAGVEAVEVPTPVLSKPQKIIRTEDGIAYSTEYWRFESGPVHRNAPNYSRGKRTFWVYSNPQAPITEIQVEIEISEEEVNIISVNGKALPIIPVEYLMPDNKAIRKAIDGGIRNIDGIYIYREDKEIYK